VEAEGIDGELFIRVRGEAGFREARVLEAGLRQPAAARPPRVTLDLTNLRFLSSLAMGVLVAFRRGVVRAGGQVRLAPDMHPAVREALDRAGLADLFETAGRPEAVRPESCVVKVDQAT
jgi:anti-anti-sigma factor